ncbi:MAG TPA: Smr/MutS family protein [bacterium]|jgi:hypothetical protein
MPEILRIVNLETGLPTGEEALRRLSEAIEAAKRDRVKALKVIHGYGSSGTGGVLRQRVQKSLANRRNQGKIRACVFGEKWNSFEEVARDVLDQCPELRRDSDLNRGNAGISIILL